MVSLKLKAKRSKKGLSGAVTALILVIASVIIALVVVGFAFGLFGALGGTPTVKQVGTGTLTGSYSNGYQAVITLQSTGNAQIEYATIEGSGVTASGSYIPNTQISPGINTVTISFPSNSIQLEEGSTYQIVIALSNGITVQAAVIYTSTS